MNHSLYKSNFYLKLNGLEEITNEEIQSTIDTMDRVDERYRLVRLIYSNNMTALNFIAVPDEEAIDYFKDIYQRVCELYPEQYSLEYSDIYSKYFATMRYIWNAKHASAALSEELIELTKDIDSDNAISYIRESTKYSLIGTYINEQAIYPENFTKLPALVAELMTTKNEYDILVEEIFTNI